MKRKCHWHNIIIVFIFICLNITLIIFLTRIRLVDNGQAYEGSEQQLHNLEKYIIDGFYVPQHDRSTTPVGGHLSATSNNHYTNVYPYNNVTATTFLEVSNLGRRPPSLPPLAHNFDEGRQTFRPTSSYYRNQPQGDPKSYQSVKDERIFLLKNLNPYISSAKSPTSSYPFSYTARPYHTLPPELLLPQFSPSLPSATINSTTSVIGNSTYKYNSSPGNSHVRLFVIIIITSFTFSHSHDH